MVLAVSAGTRRLCRAVNPTWDGSQTREGIIGTCPDRFREGSVVRRAVQQNKGLSEQLWLWSLVTMDSFFRTKKRLECVKVALFEGFGSVV